MLKYSCRWIGLDEVYWEKISVGEINFNDFWVLPPLKAQKVASIKLVWQLINFMVRQVTQALISKKCAVNWDFDCILAILRPQKLGLGGLCAPSPFQHIYWGTIKRIHTFEVSHNIIKSDGEFYFKQTLLLPEFLNLTAL